MYNVDEKLQEALNVIKDLLLFEEHDGFHDNADDPLRGCSLCWKAAEEREERGRRFLEEMDEKGNHS